METAQQTLVLLFPALCDHKYYISIQPDSQYSFCGQIKEHVLTLFTVLTSCHYQAAELQIQLFFILKTKIHIDSNFAVGLNTVMFLQVIYLLTCSVCIILVKHNKYWQKNTKLYYAWAADE